MNISHLKKLSLFQDLTIEELSTVSKIAVTEKFPKDHVLFRKGDTGDKLYVILEGAVRISLTLKDTKEEALAILERSEHFGEMALVDDTQRSTDAIIHKDAELLVISKDDFKSIMLFHKDIAYKMFWVLLRTISRRLRNSINQTEALIHMSLIF